jgi:hypothetical protein
VTSERDLRSSPALGALRGGNGGAEAEARAAAGTTTTNGEDEDEEDKEVTVEGVDVWITSEYVYSHPTFRLQGSAKANKF